MKATETFRRRAMPVPINTSLSPQWRLPLLAAFLGAKADEKHETRMTFRLSNGRQTDLSFKEVLALRAACLRDPIKYDAAFTVLNKALRKADADGLMSAQVDFPGQIPSLNYL